MSEAPARSDRPMVRKVAMVIYAVTVAVYLGFMADRTACPSPDNHFSYLADAYLHRTLAVRCGPDEMRRDREQRSRLSARCPAAMRQDVSCPPGGGGNDWARYNSRWYVPFPSFPAAVYMPAVALGGRNFPNRAFDGLLAGIAPALLYAFLEKLSRKGHALRSWRENLCLTALFAFGSVYFYSAVQGSVWFVAHVVGCALGAGYLLAALDCERPVLAGVLAGLMFHTRTSMLLSTLFFGMELVRVHRRADAVAPGHDASAFERLWRWVRGTDWRAALPPFVRFSLPVLGFIGLYMALNQARFDDWRDPGYRYLQVLWAERIHRWGLFNYHYLSRNLAVLLALLPWMSRAAPYVQISRHGLALWVTSPHYLELLRPKRTSALAWSFGVTAAAIALLDALYQNSGWVQFGYRFSNDYALFLVALVALVGRRVGRAWLVVLALAVAINAFGAATFDRPNNVYHGNNDAQGMFQGD